MDSRGSSPYEVLGVPREASAGAIKRAFREKAKRLHPDVNPSAQAAEEFGRLQAAYEVLADPARRRALDRGGATEETEGPPRGPARYAWTNIAGKGRGGARPSGADDEHDPSGFEEIYRAFFATRTGAGGVRARGPSARRGGSGKGGGQTGQHAGGQG